MVIANREYENYTNLNAYFSFQTMETWLNKYEPLYKNVTKTRKKYRKLQSIDPDALKIIENFLSYYINIENTRNEYNERFIKAEKSRCQLLFDNIEGRSLDDQQRECIVKDEINNLVVAGAGSGKTTTIVGKVKYLLFRNYSPDNLLVLSFTNASASEMAERIKKETGKNIDVMTFHKLGKEIIAKVEGKQPSITNIDLNSFIADKFDSLIRNKGYLSQVNNFFLYYLKEYKSRFDFKNEGEHIEYLKDYKITTLKKEVVKSFEEMEIANYLFINNIAYEYEAYYKIDTADNRYSRYRPDFYLPEYDIYIEHFGIDREGNVPTFFNGDGKLSAKEAYHQGIRWKRELHKKNNTILVETYSYEKAEGVLTENLNKKLKKNGVIFTPKPANEIWKVIQKNSNNDLDSFVNLINTFIVLMRTNGYSVEAVLERNNKINNIYERNRNKEFIDLIKPIYTGYINALSAYKEIDFSDMINKARTYVEEGKFDKRYSYIIIDEYQDISLPRYKLIKALKQLNEAKIFCVGDDWQSIYRFAGSDINLFTQFENYFGYTEKSFIETTYRFNNNLIELSSRFILKNKGQIAKKLTSFNINNDKAYELVYGKNRSELALKITGVLNTLPNNSNVLLLGRYREDIKLLQPNRNLTFKYHHHTQKDIVYYAQRKDLKIEFLTIHRSKGLQADYVFILNNQNGKLGFPSNLTDDKVLNLLLQGKEPYGHAEERRLFYVALTRAKKYVYIITDSNSKSVFIRELEQENQTKEKREKKLICPECKKGELIVRKGPYGKFYGCSNYPLCNYTQKINDEN